MNRRLVLVYLTATLLLGLRPFYGPAYRLAKGTHFGAYNMFTAQVESELHVSLRSGDRIIAVDSSKYFWLNPLINTTHSHVDPVVVQRFAQFLSGRPEIQELVKGESGFFVHVRLRYQRNAKVSLELYGRSDPLP